MKNIRISYNGGGTINDGLRNIPENEADYPDAIMFGRLPSYGMFIRHVENITLDNVELYFKNEEKRPALYLEDVKNGKIFDLQAHIDNSISLIKSKNSKDLYIKNPIPIEICKNIIEVSGKESKSIFLTDINKEKFKEMFIVSKEVNKNTVRIGTVFQ